MRLALLFLLGVSFVLVGADKPVLVCRDDKSDGCKCKLTDYGRGTKLLYVTCEKNTKLNTTNIVVPDSLMKDVILVDITFSYAGITQITKPLINSQLSGLIGFLEIIDRKISKIDAKVFDNLPQLFELIISGNIDSNTLNSGWLTPTLGNSLELLILQGNNITKIPSNCFKHLASLESIDMRNNQIEEIADSAFYNLPALDTLDLSQNKIQQIRSNAFGNLHLLSQLHLNNNTISEIGKSALNKFSGLKVLDLGNNNLQKIPDFFGFTTPNKLSKLILKNNKINQIAQNNFDGLDKLQILDLEYNQIEQISVGALKPLQKLTFLELANNLIRNIPAGTFDGAKQLYSITLSSNRIEKIADGVFDNLPYLQILNLDGNNKLSLSDGTFGQNGPIGLGSLNVGGCNFQTLPDTLFKNLPQLYYLRLDHNNFTQIPAPIFNTKLGILDLSSNDISTLPANAFGKVPLYGLYLNDMSKLSTISDCAFCGLTELTYLFLNNNDNLQQIDENAFGFAKNSVGRTINMGLLQIHDGGLKIVPKKLLPWDHIQDISILGNPANCDPNMDWLFRNKKYHVDKDPTPRYYDKKWCDQCKHDDVCQKLYGWKDPTTKSPRFK